MKRVEKSKNPKSVDFLSLSGRRRLRCMYYCHVCNMSII